MSRWKWIFRARYGGSILRFQPEKSSGGCKEKHHPSEFCVEIAVGPVVKSTKRPLFCAIKRLICGVLQLGRAKQKNKKHKFQDLGNKPFLGSVADFLEEVFFGERIQLNSVQKGIWNTVKHSLDARLKVLMSLGFELETGWFFPYRLEERVSVGPSRICIYIYTVYIHVGCPPSQVIVTTYQVS